VFHSRKADRRGRSSGVRRALRKVSGTFGHSCPGRLSFPRPRCLIEGRSPVGAVFGSGLPARRPGKGFMATIRGEDRQLGREYVRGRWGALP
jgi:hypothetical protein